MAFFNEVDLFFAEIMHKVQVGAGVFMTPFLKIVSLLGNGGAVFLVTAFILLFFKNTRKTGVAVFIALLVGLLLTNVLLKNIVARDRPFADISSIYYEYWVSSGSLSANGYSFPSGHTTAATAFAIVLFLFGNKKFSWMLFIIPILMGMSRVYFSVHFATDIFGGIVVGVISAIIAWGVIKLLAKNNNINKFFEARDIVDIIKSKNAKS